MAYAVLFQVLCLDPSPDKDVSDIMPFKLTLPGDTPSIPLRLSAVAAEPEMGIVVWIFGEQRYEPANARELEIPNRDLRRDAAGRSNWLSLVARAVDAVDGHGFVVESAQPVASLRSSVQSSFTGTTDQMGAQRALLDLLDGTSYVTRLYTRLSPEEMTFDPLFKRSAKGDVARVRTLAASSQCSAPPPADPCDFSACGSLGLCRPAGDQSGCACAPGATARTSFVPSASGQLATMVSCVDKRLSFLNPGDKNAAGEVLPDPCVGVDCGGHGRCVPMNMTATCECDRGYVAQGSVDSAGARVTTCRAPSAYIPDSFYNRRAAPRDASLPIGRAELTPPPTSASDPADPLPEGNLTAMRGARGGACAIATARAAAPRYAVLLASFCVLLWTCARRRARRC